MLCFITGCAKPTTYTYRTTGKGDKKGLDIGYIDGPFDACIPLDISEDGNSLIYKDIIFTKE